MESVERKASKKIHWLYGVIALLLFGLVIETGLLLKERRASKTSPFIRHEAYDTRSYFPQRSVSSQRTRLGSSASDPADPAGAVRPRSYDPWFEDAFEQMHRMQERMNRIVNTALTYGPPMMRDLTEGGVFDFAPAIDLKETDTAYVVQSDLPGLEKDKINVTVKGNLLTLQGIRKTESETQDEDSGFYAQERSYGSFARSISLPGPVDESKITADYQNGVLTITLPKTGELEAAQKINIQ